MLRSVGANAAGGEQLTLVCQHWRSFPPVSALNPKDIEQQRQDKEVSQTEYQHHLVWKRICGLTWMDKRKCRHCAHVRYLKRKGELWVLETPDGKLAVPVIDLATIESLSRQKDARPLAKGAHAPGRRNYVVEDTK